MDLFTNGELKPSDDPDMVAPAKDPPPQSDQQESAKEVDPAKIGAAKTASVAANSNRNTVDEFKDKEGLHYKADMKATSKTPGPNMLISGSNLNQQIMVNQQQMM